ncbi:FecR family protein [bacterium A37T11]|nr:FecR family protein [bacterium A37T11]
MEHTHLKYLLEQYLGGSATEAERDELLAWYHSFNHEEVAWPAEGPEEEAAVFRRLQQNILDKTRPVIQKKPHRLIWLTSAAALFIVSLATSLYFYRSGAIVNRKSTIVNQAIIPGYNQATLTLADGTKLALDSAQSGIIVNDENIKYNNGEIIKNVMLSEDGGKEASGAETSLPTSLTLTTPKGGQYQIILSDGTKVWLNAASTLKYPSRFTEDKREVFLEGEAFFQIADVKGKPFKVKTPKQEVLVLATSFNLSAYSNETSEKTTLVEGKVQVRSENVKRKTYNLQLLKPKQQAVVKGDSLTISTVNVDNETAWRNGRFDFNHKNLEQALRELSRWYNFEVIYEGKAPDIEFFGDLLRNSQIKTVLNLLEANEIKYRLEPGKKLVIIGGKGGQP